jgi:hypothetical protein
MIYSAEGQPLIACTVRDVSANGAKLELAKEVELPGKFKLALSRDGAVLRNCFLAWQFATVVGVRFSANL